jgi:hypothetical protein
MLQVRFLVITTAAVAGLFLGMLVFLEFGRRLGLRQLSREGADARLGVGVVDNIVYALLGLLIGFTFSGAAARFDHRRDLVAQEVNAIGTAWQRLDLLPAEPREAIRSGFRRYADALLVSYTKGASLVDPFGEPAPLARAQDDIWSRAVAACLAPSGEGARILLLPALNEMFDVVQTERMARRMHPPIVIFAMLGVTALAAALLAGYGIASTPMRNWIYLLGIAATVSVAAYVIIDLEYPRLGFINIDATHQLLVDLRATMK